VDLHRQPGLPSSGAPPSVPHPDIDLPCQSQSPSALSSAAAIGVGGVQGSSIALTSPGPGASGSSTR
jgi:hypothetical protein